MDEAALKKIIDGLCEFAENRLRASHGLVWMVGFVETARLWADTQGVAEILQFLKSKGLV